MKNVISIIIIFFSLNCFSQTLLSEFNFDFEQTDKRSNLPVNWFQWGKYEIRKDSLSPYNGKFSSVIISNENGNFGSIAYSLPAIYTGEKITLEGFIKIKNVKNGFAGLMLRIDNKDSTLVFNNMQDQQIKGTKDWKKYSLTLQYPKNGQTIYVAGILSGKGEAWFDDFTVTIDGENIKNFKKEIPKAVLDKEFDEGSKFQLSNVTSSQVDNLFKLCKVWGYLKYHHPEIAKGNVNWDYELFRIMPKINSKDFNSDMLTWIKSLEGENIKTTTVLKLSNAQIPLNNKWILNDSLLDKNISQKLIEIQKTDLGNSNYYIQFERVGNPSFQNENPYSDMKWDDTGFKLLSLFRYWNMIEYFFPYKHLIDTNWDDILLEYIPKIILSNDELSYKLTILGLIGEIQDSHANFWDKTLITFYGNRTAPIEVGFIEDQPTIIKTFNQLDSNSKIKIGDVIIKINDVQVKDVIETKIKYIPGSNYSTQLRDLSKILLRTNEDTIEVTFKNELGLFKEKITTVDFKEINFWTVNKPSHESIDEDIGYIYSGALKRGEIDTIMSGFLNKKGLIIDLRGYPSDFIPFSLGKYLMPKPTEFVKFSTTSMEKPGQFKFTPPVKVGVDNPDYYKGRVVILINEETQSQGEFTAMALSVSPNAILIGSQTAGTDGNISAIYLPGNVRTHISGKGVNYPDGTETQRIGIIPDIKIEPTIKGIKNKEDEALLRAIEYIKRGN